GMCQLFPYAFTETPTGVYSYVSFASTGVLFNSGRLLSEQADVLRGKWQLYKKLFPRVEHDWSRLQILDGHALEWNEYLLIENELLNILADNKRTALEKLQACSRQVVRTLPSGVSAEVTPPLPARPKIVDQLMLKHLMRLYLPSDVFGESRFDMDARQL